MKIANDSTYELYTPQQIISSSPTNGPYHGGTLIQVLGLHFRSNVDYVCLFDNSTNPSSQYSTSDFMECGSPMMTESIAVAREVTTQIAEKESECSHGELSFSFGQPFSLDYVQPKPCNLDKRWFSFIPPKDMWWLLVN